MTATGLELDSIHSQMHTRHDKNIQTNSIGAKMDESVLEEKSSFKMMGLTFSSKLDWGYYII